jgi:hypothetical protein
MASRTDAKQPEFGREVPRVVIFPEKGAIGQAVGDFLRVGQHQLDNLVVPFGNRISKSKGQESMRQTLGQTWDQIWQGVDADVQQNYQVQLDDHDFDLLDQRRQTLTASNFESVVDATREEIRESVHWKRRDAAQDDETQIDVTIDAAAISQAKKFQNGKNVERGGVINFSVGYPDLEGGGQRAVAPTYFWGTVLQHLHKTDYPTIVVAAAAARKIEPTDPTARLQFIRGSVPPTTYLMTELLRLHANGWAAPERRSSTRPSTVAADGQSPSSQRGQHQPKAVTLINVVNPGTGMAMYEKLLGSYFGLDLHALGGSAADTYRQVERTRQQPDRIGGYYGPHNGTGFGVRMTALRNGEYDVSIDKGNAKVGLNAWKQTGDWIKSPVGIAMGKEATVFLEGITGKTQKKVDAFLSLGFDADDLGFMQGSLNRKLDVINAWRAENGHAALNNIELPENFVFNAMRSFDPGSKTWTLNRKAWTAVLEKLPGEMSVAVHGTLHEYRQVLKGARECLEIVRPALKQQWQGQTDEQVFADGDGMRDLLLSLTDEELAVFDKMPTDW